MKSSVCVFYLRGIQLPRSSKSLSLMISISVLSSRNTQQFERDRGLSSESWIFKVQLYVCYLVLLSKVRARKFKHLPKEFLRYFEVQWNASQLLGRLNFTLKIQYKIII